MQSKVLGRRLNVSHVGAMFYGLGNMSMIWIIKKASVHSPVEEL